MSEIQLDFESFKKNKLSIRKTCLKLIDEVSSYFELLSKVSKATKVTKQLKRSFSVKRKEFEIDN